MKRLILILAVVGMSGCSTIKDWIPSRWDVNQAKSITDIQQDARRIDCKADLVPQIAALDKDVEWFNLYAKTKPTHDVAKLTVTLTNTVTEFKDRASKGPVSPLYCDLKKKLILQQADIIAAAVQGRF